MDLALLTESSDEDVGAVGGGSAISLQPSANAYQVERCSEDLSRHINSLDALSLSSDTDSDDNMHRQSGAFSFGSGCGGIDDEPEATTENLIEYSEVLVPATKAYTAAVEETGVLLNLLEDVSSASASACQRSTARPGLISG